MIKMNRSYRCNHYETTECPLNRFIWLGRCFMISDNPQKRHWRFDIKDAIFDRDFGLLSFRSWHPENDGFTLCGTWNEFAKNIWNNICVLLTPWYRPRRLLIENFVNPNGSKLLSSNRKSACVRTRSADTEYFEITCGPMTATVTRRRLVGKNGKGRNAFIASIIGAKDDDGNEEQLEWKSETVLSGPCLTMGQCDRLFDRIVAAIPELNWIID